MATADSNLHLGPFSPGTHLGSEVASCLCYSRGISNRSLWTPSAFLGKKQYITAVTILGFQVLIFYLLEGRGLGVLGRG